MSLAAIEIRLMVRGSLIGPMRSITLARRDSAPPASSIQTMSPGMAPFLSAGRTSKLAPQLAVGRRHQADAVAAVGLLVEAEDLLRARCPGGG